MKPGVKSMVERLAKRKPITNTTPANTGTKGGTTPRDLFGMNGGGAPHVTTGEFGTSRGYSAQKAVTLARNPGYRDQAKLESHVSDLMDALYVDTKQWTERSPNGVMMPLGLDLMPDEIQNEPAYQEVKALVLEGAKAPDPDEVKWLRKAFHGTKAQSWLDTYAGGSLVGAPVQGELIDLLRNKLAFGNADITAMPPTGVRFPRWTQDPGFTWASENEEVSATSASTGELVFRPKKGMTIVDYPNELVMYGSPSVDAMFRSALMARVALGMDAGLLRGDGSDDQPWGLLTMARLQATDGVDFGLNLITIANGTQILQDAPQDLMNFPSAIEGQNGELTQWIGRPDYFWNILKQRFSTIAANDGQGGFLYDFARAAKDGFPPALLGVPYNKTNQLLRTEPENPTDEDYPYRTDLIGLSIKDFWIGMLGAVEIVAATETEFKKDKTLLRAKIYGNGGAKHPGQVAVALDLAYSA